VIGFRLTHNPYGWPFPDGARSFSNAIISNSRNWDVVVAILTWLSSWSEKAKLLDAILAYTLISPIHFRKPRSLFLKDTNAHDRIRIVGIDLSLCNE
jgi:hypothetical protein